jgi:hypothetical protein
MKGVLQEVRKRMVKVALTLRGSEASESWNVGSLERRFSIWVCCIGVTA